MCTSPWIHPCVSLLDRAIFCTGCRATTIRTVNLYIFNRPLKKLSPDVCHIFLGTGCYSLYVMISHFKLNRLRKCKKQKLWLKLFFLYEVLAPPWYVCRYLRLKRLCDYIYTHLQCFWRRPYGGMYSLFFYSSSTSFTMQKSWEINLFVSFYLYHLVVFSFVNSVLHVLFTSFFVWVYRDL